MMAFSGAKLIKEAMRGFYKIHWDLATPMEQKNTNNSERVD
jgi:hypothetical protein